MFSIEPLSSVGFSLLPSVSFSTNFSDAPQNPISQGGIWFHTTNAWANIATTTSPNRAIGTQTGSGGFNDSYAYLKGLSSSVSVTATVYKDPALSANDPFGAHEVELLFRVSDDATNVHAYECNFSTSGAYAQIARWFGPMGTFDTISNIIGIDGNGALTTGDQVMATITGGLSNTVITTYIKRVGGSFVQIAQVTAPNDGVTPPIVGQHGIGMWYDGSAPGPQNSLYGFSDYSLVNL